MDMELFSNSLLKCSNKTLELMVTNKPLNTSYNSLTESKKILITLLLQKEKLKEKELLIMKNSEIVFKDKSPVLPLKCLNQTLKLQLLPIELIWHNKRERMPKKLQPDIPIDYKIDKLNVQLVLKFGRTSITTSQMNSQHVVKYYTYLKIREPYQQDMDCDLSDLRFMISDRLT